MILFPGALEVITKPVQIRWKRTNTYTILYYFVQKSHVLDQYNSFHINRT